ncbi:MAG: hypothetical protein K6U87_03850 [Firmicutes bacterium]|nr:hypothetical protein [Bacillota bacterium]
MEMGLWAHGQGIGEWRWLGMEPPTGAARRWRMSPAAWSRERFRAELERVLSDLEALPEPEKVLRMTRWFARTRHLWPTFPAARGREGAVVPCYPPQGQIWRLDGLAAEGGSRLARFRRHWADAVGRRMAVWALTYHRLGAGWLEAYRLAVAIEDGSRARVVDGRLRLYLAWVLGQESVPVYVVGQLR